MSQLPGPICSKRSIPQGLKSTELPSSVKCSVRGSPSLWTVCQLCDRCHRLQTAVLLLVPQHTSLQPSTLKYQPSACLRSPVMCIQCIWNTPISSLCMPLTNPWLPAVTFTLQNACENVIHKHMVDACHAAQMQSSYLYFGAAKFPSIRAANASRLPPCLSMISFSFSSALPLRMLFSHWKSKCQHSTNGRKQCMQP